MIKDMEIVFSGGKGVEAKSKDFVISTDQSVDNGGGGSAPEPFTLFLASLGTCAGYYALVFCQTRQIPTEGMRLKQRATRNDENKRLERVEIEIELPDGFPAKYQKAIQRAASQCAVKKALFDPPEIVLSAKEAQSSES